MRADRDTDPLRDGELAYVHMVAAGLDGASPFLLRRIVTTLDVQDEIIKSLHGKRDLFVSCPQCAGSGYTAIDEDEDNCDLCNTKGFASLASVVAWENDL